jgi:hypothetical protein
MCRDKAPFMLIVEVLGAGAEDKNKAANAVAEESVEESAPEGKPASQDSRLQSHAAAGPGTKSLSDYASVGETCRLTVGVTIAVLSCRPGTPLGRRLEGGGRRFPPHKRRMAVSEG